MRELHRRATADAEAKRTELRLVLASRYRELVGSSDEVLHMQARAKELDDLVRALPGLAERLARCAERISAAGADGQDVADDFVTEEKKSGSDSDTEADQVDNAARRSLASLPRRIHRCLDRSDVHGAATGLIELFHLIASRTNAYPLATALSGGSAGSSELKNPLLESQMKMIYLHVQTLPDRTVRLSRRLLHRAAGSHPSGSAAGAAMTASALSALDLLDPNRSQMSEDQRAVRLLDLYYESKARLIRGLLERLGRTEDGAGGGEGGAVAAGTSGASTAAATSDEAADDILGRIVHILQYDILLHPYQIFVLKRFRPPTEDGAASREEQQEEEAVMLTMPQFDPAALRTKASNFLASHLPLIRNKAKAVLMNIAGTTAARLGNIRQSLYDKTDGAECRRALDGNGLCGWDEAVNCIVDFRTVSSHGTQLFSPEKGGNDGTVATSRRSARPREDLSSGASPDRRFSLWSALFSATFSSLVHSILTSSFHSVHTRVIGTLRSSLAAAPPLRSIMPHEAHRNALRIATDLDLALIKVSDDAHELLVHAEEREESERRLRQSLYVQTCEIMGRLLNELRRMLDANKDKMADVDEEEATTELIVGRLCHLLKFRLSCLPTLLDSSSSPAAMAAAVGQKSGMISLAELRSSFEIADDDEDGLISVEEAEEAVESAFSGTVFKGAEMVKDTLLLSASTRHSVLGGENKDNGNGEAVSESSRNVTLSELVLLSARGLRHDKSGAESALGTIQRSLDETIAICFAKWSRVILHPTLKEFRTIFERRMVTSTTACDMEWRRLNGLLCEGEEENYRKTKYKEDLPDINRPPTAAVGNVSAHMTAYLLGVAAALNSNICPSDSLPPVASTDLALHMGMAVTDGKNRTNSIPNMMQIIRGALLEEAVTSVTSSVISILKDDETSTDDNDDDEATSRLSKCSTSALLQLQLDITFISHSFFERNHNGFTVSSSGVALTNEDRSQQCRNHLERLAGDISSYVDHDVVSDPSAVKDSMREKHLQSLRSCDLFLSALFGEGEVASLNMSALAGPSSSSSLGGDAPPPLVNPLPSSRRFNLLPVQAERSLDELRLRSKYGKEKEDAAEAESAAANASAVTSGFGFFSSMLKKK